MSLRRIWSFCQSTLRHPG
uniref:3-ketoacyl-CoA synthase 4 n=1 Tax=Rhizophora mucronata TaxID=61149 RepID=A0A2P2Q0J5_RHIMU